jgi:hypothetical protein
LPIVQTLKTSKPKKTGGKSWDSNIQTL